MQQQTMDYMLEEIFGTFGRQRPAYGSPAYRALERRITDRQIPDEAARPIATALGDYDSLPANLGKAIAREFANWLEAHPEKRLAAQACPDCDKATPGFFTAWRDGIPVTVICACNSDSGYEGKLPGPMSKRQAREKGLETSPRAAKVSEQAKAILSAIGRTEPLRPAHKAQLEEMEAW